MSAFSNNIKRVAGLTKLSDFQTKKGEANLRVSPDLIDCLPQIRTRNNPGFSAESIAELANAIVQVGQLNAVILRPHPSAAGRYLMIAGERRFRAAKHGGFDLDAIIRDVDDATARRIQRTENVQSEALTNLEEAIQLDEDMAKLGSLKAVAEEWNKSINWVAERLKFIEVLDEPKRSAARAMINEGLSADVSAVNEMARLEKKTPRAAKAALAELRNTPKVNVRAVIRKHASPAAKPATDANKAIPTQASPTAPSLPAQRWKAPETGPLAISMAKFIALLKTGGDPVIFYDDGVYRAHCPAGQLGEAFVRLDVLLAALANHGVSSVRVELSTLPTSV